MSFLAKSKSVNFDLAVSNLTNQKHSRESRNGKEATTQDIVSCGNEKFVSVQLSHNNDRKKTKEMMYDACYEGTRGSFNEVKNDFSITTDFDEESSKYFRNHPDWSEEECKKVKRFRFVIATMTLFALLLCLTSRTVINVGIVEMTKSQNPIPSQTDDDNDNFNNSNVDDKSIVNEEKISRDVRSLEDIDMNNNHNAPDNDFVGQQTDDNNREYKIEWTPKKKNYLISSFYMGYAPSMMLTGGLANKYGAWWPLFLAVFFSFIINAVTPLITSYSYTLLFISRLVLGIVQGCVMPATYDIFSKWLTMTETSIFAPMIKVSFGMGALIGSALPFITNYFGYGWPYLFYESSLLCGLWSIGWYFLATSTPQTNKWVEPNELNRIMRKKLPANTTSMNNIGSNQMQHQNQNNCFKLEDLKTLETMPNAAHKNSIDNRDNNNNINDLAKESTPWLLIAFNRSVIALAITKFTYNLGADFVCLELALYLDKIHSCSMDTISQISSAGFLMQALLSTGVGWLAKYAVQNKSFGLSKSKWRKIFQGFSNFGMSIIYFILAFADPDFNTIISLLLIVFFLWMFGAGGESIVAYDLSLKYPATITGFAHSIGILSSVSLPAICDFILQQEDFNNERWKTVFLLIAVLTLLGGFVFILLLKPKPFLPGEKEEEKRRKSSTLK